MAALAAALAAVLFVLVAVAEADTDAADVAALGNLYSSWNSPAQLAGWSAGGGDPCGAAWMGVSCTGSAVTSIKLSGLGLNGTLGYQLSNLAALKTMDLSDNNFHDAIPYQLPQNLSYMNLARNNLSGNLPYSISNIVSLEYLYMQNNQLSGTIDMLSNLSLATLNIANNNFSGMIPQQFSSIPNFIVAGNSFSNMPASPPLIVTPPEHPRNPQGPVSAPTSPEILIDQDKKEGMHTGPLVAIAVGSIAAASGVLFMLVFCLHNSRKRNDDGSSEPKDIISSLDVNIERASNVEVRNNNHENAAITTSVLQPTGKISPERIHDTNGSTAKKTKIPVIATSYTVASLQVATNSFCQDSLLGEGSLGRVYKADFPNGKVLAVKKIDSAALSLYEEDNFLEVVSNISRLRHPNIVPLTGYCTEHGQRLLVYEYIGNGTLHDILHFSDGMSKNLTWNTRVRIALGTARALEYLHEVCLPPVVQRNLKSSNILLDEENSPHLSDCGLAALSPNPEREISSEIIGSFGYSAPEFAMSGTYTLKGEVRTVSCQMGYPQLHDIDLLAKMVDPALDGMYPAKSLSRFADIIAICVQPEPEFRPPMSEVVQQLVRMMQRASIVRRHSDDLGFSYRVPDREVGDIV
ncbi:hypothetical protein PR202_ga14882 [Eleusine coracana subsp. coracana]|uniref:Protein kinase domain-containing protein n=1 Tax=Eleusine coracana subsp. coracana TaxID=191504 RepID=A0AAV5CIE4_ELECO|nr:hypothetical protein PR202_ga14882 [Eleusine coracana subsp. coracana]